jgi:hypothetical protein
MTECPVCCEKYTTMLRTEVKCKNCEYTCCVKCVKSYLLTIFQDPHCMNCNFFWNTEFMDTHLTRSWRNGEWKRHRGKVLFDRERSLMPNTQNDVAIELRRREEQETKNLLLQKKKEIFNQIRELNKELYDIRVNIDRASFFIETGRYPNENSTTQKERRQFVSKCLSKNCRGFLNNHYKCGLCEKQFCSKCREAKESDEHTCNEDLVASVALIVSETTPCPKCGIRIHRITGCDQMFCTQCFTGFSYSKGTIIRKVLHNPHYFERLATLRGTQGNECDEEGDGWPTLRNCISGCSYNTMCKVTSYYQVGRHIQHEEFAPENDNTDIRIQYLLNEIDDITLCKLLQQRETLHIRTIEINSILEVCVLIIIEWFQSLAKNIGIIDMRIKDNYYTTKLNELANRIEVTVNTPLRAYADRERFSVPQIFLPGPNAHRAQFNKYGYRPTKSVKDTTTS